MQVGGCVIPQKSKAVTGGEDWMQISNDGLMLTMVDGVGSWAKKGVNAGLYSRELCRNYQSIYEN